MSGIVQILLGDGVVAEERRVAIHIQLDPVLVCFGDRDFRLRLGELCARLRQLALRLRQPPFGLIQIRLKWPWIDLEKQLTLADERALGIFLFYEITRNLGLDFRVDKTIDRTSNGFCAAETLPVFPHARSHMGPWPPT